MPVLPNQWGTVSLSNEANCALVESRSTSCDFTDGAPNMLGFLASTDTTVLWMPACVRTQHSTTMHSGNVLRLHGALLL